MKMTEMFLGELEEEGKLTRRALEQVPDGHAAWKPHEKSMPFGRLAEMVAQMPSWVAMMIERDELDVNPKSGPTQRMPEIMTRDHLLTALDEGVKKAHDALSRTNDAHLMTSWRMLAGGRVVSEQPRYAAIRSGVFNHLAHHRGQLTVYLRLLGAKVPAIYGPSADDPRFS